METGKRQDRKAIRMNAHGGHGGTAWDDGSFTGIREISLTYGHCVDSIRVDYDLNGKTVQGDKHGGAGGYHTTQVKIQYPEEFLTTVSGYYCPLVNGGTPVIRALTFKTNQRSWGPFGMEHGTPFTISMDGGSIVGFHGRSGWYLDSIGFYLAPMNRGLRDMVHQKLRSFSMLASRTLIHNGDEDREHVRTTKVSS